MSTRSIYIRAILVPVLALSAVSMSAVAAPRFDGGHGFGRVGDADHRDHGMDGRGGFRRDQDHRDGGRDGGPHDFRRYGRA